MWEYNYDYLEHHGILGQKWGVRRFQNADGSLTDAGKRRYKTSDVKEAKRRSTAVATGAVLSGISAIQTAQNYARAKNAVAWLSEGQFTAAPLSSWINAGIKQSAKVALISGLTVYGGMKVADFIKEQKNKH